MKNNRNENNSKTAIGNMRLIDFLKNSESNIKTSIEKKGITIKIKLEV